MQIDIEEEERRYKLEAFKKSTYCLFWLNIAPFKHSGDVLLLIFCRIRAAFTNICFLNCVAFLRAYLD